MLKYTLFYIIFPRNLFETKRSNSRLILPIERSLIHLEESPVIKISNISLEAMRPHWPQPTRQFMAMRVAIPSNLILKQLLRPVQLMI